MSVYVDNARIPFGDMLMSHMIADSIDELFEMADRIDLARRHFQNGSHPHFDVSVTYRTRAIRAGAQPVGRRELVAAMRDYQRRLKTDRHEVARLGIAIRTPMAFEITPAFGLFAHRG